MAEVEVERSTVVAAPPGAVYPHLVDFHRWREWSPWEGLDPALERSYEGAESGPGARYSWRGNRKAGAGSMEIVRADPDRAVDIDLRFDKPFKSHNRTSFDLQPESGGTRVVWRMVAPKTVGTRVMGLLGGLDRLVGKDFERGLAGLKRVTEQERPDGAG